MEYNKLSAKKQEVRRRMDNTAGEREKWLKKNSYYYRDLNIFFRHNILAHSSILEIGCGTGDLLNSLKPKRGVGIDISSEMIKNAKQKFPHLEFLEMDAENVEINEKFDYIVISDTLGYFEDIQKVFREIKKIVGGETRVIITFHSFLWTPFLRLAEILRLKMPQNRLNWLNRDDIVNLLSLEGYDVIKSGKRFLMPKKIPLLSNLINKYIANLPIINSLCFTGFIIARPISWLTDNDKNKTVSVIIPARNEAGNIENAILRTPPLGRSTEFIFIEGNSADDTYNEIIRVSEKYKGQYNIKYSKQDGRGKGDAVRKGFNMASGEILMILDSDLTVPPEELLKFYEAIASGKGEFINGSRLVYPVEKEAMPFLNMLGNKFFSVAISWLLGQKLKDTFCGTKVISKKNYDRLAVSRLYFGEFDQFGDLDLIFGSAKLNLKIVEVPIRYKARSYGETKMAPFKQGWLFLKMILFAMDKIKFI